MTTSTLGSSLQLSLHFHLWPPLASYIPSLSCSPSPLPPCSFQYHVGDPYTLPSLAANLRYKAITLRATSSACWPWGNTPRKVPPQWCWSLINHRTAGSLASGIQNIPASHLGFQTFSPRLRAYVGFLVLNPFFGTGLSLSTSIPWSSVYWWLDRELLNLCNYISQSL